MPEQYFDSIANADKSENYRAGLADYTARVEANVAAETLMRQMDLEQRVQRKREEKGSYLALVSARIAKETLPGQQPPPMEW